MAEVDVELDPDNDKHSDGLFNKKIREEAKEAEAEARNILEKTTILIIIINYNRIQLKKF